MIRTQDTALRDVQDFRMELTRSLEHLTITSIIYAAV